MPNPSAKFPSGKTNRAAMLSQADQRADEKYVQKASHTAKDVVESEHFPQPPPRTRQRVIQRRLRCLVLMTLFHAAVLAPGLRRCPWAVATARGIVHQANAGIPTNSGEPYNTGKASPRGYRSSVRGLWPANTHHRSKWICSSTL